MKIFSWQNFKKRLAYDWIYYVLSIVLSIVLWRGAFGLLHRYKFYEKIELFIAANIVDDSFNEEIILQVNDPSLKSFELNQALPSDSAFASKLQYVGYQYSDLLILSESVISNIACDEVFLLIDQEIKESYLEKEEEYFLFEEESYGFLLRDVNKSSWLDEYINFDISEKYYLFVSGASQNISNKGNYQTPEYDLALKCLKVLLG
ncbi:MAG: hypothetical protein WCZ47_00360 [Bacilli bacterium]